MPPTIALLTDFGTHDHYVGAMKGAALSICGDAALVDITHEIPPQDVLGGALSLAAAFAYFPAGTVFVAVVDPGVGSHRRAIAASAGDYLFVAPDNGLLTLVFRNVAPSRVVELANAHYARSPVSRTFEGRDRFAPAAAWLARGTELDALGPALSDWRVLDIPVPHATGEALQGEVLVVDRFGNLVTNIDRAAFLRLSNGRAMAATAGNERVAFVTTYADASPGTVCALFGSTDHLEIAVNGGSAAARLNLARGAPVVVTPA